MFDDFDLYETCEEYYVEDERYCFVRDNYQIALRDEATIVDEEEIFI